MNSLISENSEEKELSKDEKAISLCKEGMISMIEQMNDLINVGELYEMVVYYYNRAK